MLGTIYRASYTDTLSTKNGESKIEENIRKATEISNRLIMHGDFNVDLLQQNNKKTKTLNEIYTSYGLKQYIKKPTRIDPDTAKPTLIDHIWANEDLNMIKKTGTVTGISDHFGTYMVLNRPKPVKETQTIKCRSYKNYDPQNFSSDLKENIRNSSISNYIEEKDVNKATGELVKTIQDTAQIHTPLREIKIF